MPLALSQYETLLLVVAGTFIAFALIVALVVPRSRPGFPANRLGIFVGVCVVLFLAQLSAVLLLAEKGEADEPVAEGTSTTPTETTPTETTPTETTSTETTPTETTPAETETETETETTPTGVQGDPVAGKEVFLSIASPPCASCHTLSDAGSTGSVGPNLDDASPSYDKVVEQVTEGGGVMPAFGSTLSEQQIADVAAYVSSVAGN